MLIRFSVVVALALKFCTLVESTSHGNFFAGGSHFSMSALGHCQAWILAPADPFLSMGVKNPFNPQGSRIHPGHADLGWSGTWPDCKNLRGLRNSLRWQKTRPGPGYTYGVPATWKIKWKLEPPDSHLVPTWKHATKGISRICSFGPQLAPHDSVFNLGRGPCTVFLARIFSVFGPGNQIGIPAPKKLARAGHRTFLE